MLTDAKRKDAYGFVPKEFLRYKMFTFAARHSCLAKHPRHWVASRVGI